VSLADPGARLARQAGRGLGRETHSPPLKGSASARLTLSPGSSHSEGGGERESARLNPRPVDGYSSNILRAVPQPARTSLAEAVRTRCLEILRLAGFRVARLPPMPDGVVPDVELHAQELLGRLQRDARAALREIPGDTVCGPATAFLHEHREALKRLVRPKGKHWRAHSATRTSPTQRAVDTYGSTSSNGAKLTDRQVAAIALLHGARLQGDTVASCLDAETRAIRRERRR